MAGVKTTAIYLRVSTVDQTIDSQRDDLAATCRQRGWTDTTAYEDQASGADASRPALARLMTDVRSGRVDRIVCFKLDRLGRSLSHLARIIDELAANGVALLCPSQGIDTSDSNPAGRLQMHILAAVAEFERSIIRDRVKAGIAAARAHGKHLGRPKGSLGISPKKRALLQKEVLANPTITVRELALRVGVSVGSASKLRRQGSGRSCGG